VNSQFSPLQYPFITTNQNDEEKPSGKIVTYQSNQLLISDRKPSEKVK